MGLRPLPSFALFVVAAGDLASAIGESQARNSARQGDAVEDEIVLTGRRVAIPEICEGSWCAGPNVLEVGESRSLAGIILSRDDRQVTVTGHVHRSSATRRSRDYAPRTFVLPQETAPPPVTILRSRDLSRGVDLEVAGADGQGLGILRMEETWRGVVWGVVTGWEFPLDGGTLTIVDADLDGRLSPSDRFAYGSRSIWMPWHTVTSSNDTIYYGIKASSSNELTARTMRMDDRGTDAAVWTRWQEERMNQGVPPGLFSAELQRHCVSHAEYSLINQYRGHSQDPDKPGYSEEGHRAGMSSCISYTGRDSAMQLFLDTLYHRPQLIDPRDVGLQLGGNSYAYLMGRGLGPGLPSETRRMEQPQLHPAPGSRVPHGAYKLENPEHPIYSETGSPGLPVIVRVPEGNPAFSAVDCRLFRVRGGIRTGRRVDEVRCHLSHRGRAAPPSYPRMWSMIALTPFSPLSPGVYEADFSFTQDGAAHHYQWRFTVGR